MYLNLMVFAESTIKNIGRGTSHIWEICIHSHISKTHEGIAQKMSYQTPFPNIAFIEAPKD